METENRLWFILNDSKVSGPFSKSEIETQAGTMSNALIWGRGQGDWVNAARWSKLVKESEETHRRHRQQAERLWKISDSGQEQRAMNHEQMLEYLRSKNDLSQVLIWTEGYSEWKEIYQIHKIMDELGVSRRHHPRVPIMGTLLCEGATGNFEARVLSVSEGGLGVTETPPIKIGEKFKTILKSPNLFAPIHATAEIVYLGNDGYAGLKFIGLQSESKSALIEYIKKFQDAKSNSTP